MWVSSMSTQELRFAILHEITSRLGDVGKIKLQKLVYFLQEAKKVPTRYPYKMHHYGPYAESVETDTAKLKFMGYVEVQPDSQGYGFHITPADDPREEWANILQPYSEPINSVVDILSHRPISELELAATIHYMKKLRPNLPIEEVLQMVRALKPKFGEQYVSDIHSDLERLGFLD